MDNPGSGHILVLDDDPAFHRIAEFLLSKHGYRVTSHDDPAVAMRSNESDGVDAVLLDWQLGDRSGLELMPTIRQALPRTPIILVTAYSSTDLAVESIKSGAFDFLPKPLDEPRLVSTLAKAMEHRRLLHLVDDLAESSDASGRFEGMIGQSPEIRTVFRIIRDVSPTDVSVLIRGESGTGKELVARAIHDRSPRSEGPFVAINMAALPKELVESTLFGHERGAFTGADRVRIGAVEEANGGTLLLDEIGEMPAELQPKLLRFLQEKTFRRVGGSSDRATDVRIVSATNRDPLAEIDAGRLRADLFYRLNVVPIHLPPLRQRGDDVIVIALAALRDLAAKYGKSFETIDEAARRRLKACRWPGNVRQLIHVIERVVVLNDGPVLTREMLPADLDAEPGQTEEVADRPAGSTDPRSIDRPATGGDPVRFAPSEIVPFSEIEKRAIAHALAVTAGSVPETASRLEISEATIYRKIKAYGIKR